MRTWIVLGCLAAAVPARADRTTYHAEIDPLPFVNGGYGAQVGIRDPAFHGLRFAIASFALHEPDLVSQIGNAGFDLRVRPSGALYILYYLKPPGRDGFSIGGSVRYLRLRYEHDDFPGYFVDVAEISPEAIIGYQWHPFHNGFYLQPWLALGVVLVHSGKPTLGYPDAKKTYDEMPISPFFTVNIGWEVTR